MAELKQLKWDIGGYSVRVFIHNHRSENAIHKNIPLILLNGIGASADALLPLMQTFKDREVVVFDVPVAKSTVQGLQCWGMQRYAAFTTSLLDRLNFQCVDVLGYSWGGALAQEMVYRHPSRVNKLILVATSPGHLMVPGRVERAGTASGS